MLCPITDSPHTDPAWCPSASLSLIGGDGRRFLFLGLCTLEVTPEFVWNPLLSSAGADGLCYRVQTTGLLHLFGLSLDDSPRPLSLMSCSEC